jgi:predicted  nucleic acid-binding Zn-ribbon protein
MITELDQLEEKIRAAAELLTRLRDEKRDLEVENGKLRERVQAMERAVADLKSTAHRPEIRALEEERATLLEERRVIARRVEDMLQKLELLERAVHA